MYECPSTEVLEEMGFDLDTTFGMEFEFYCVDQDREGVAHHLTFKTGIDVYAEHYNHDDGSHWKIVTDASLEDGEEGGEYNCEDCDVQRECDMDCSYNCTPSYSCDECSVHTWDGPEDERPECDDGDCANLHDYPEFHCEDCTQDRWCDECCYDHCDRSNTGNYGMELVSPILKGYEGLAQVYALLNALEDLDCVVNSDCGLHIHLDGDISLGATRNLATLALKYEATIDSVLPESRRQNSNCRSMCGSQWGSRGLSEKTRLERIAFRFDQVESATVMSDLLAIWNDRYMRVNFEALHDHGTVEFRQHAGTLNAEKALHWTILCMQMRQCALKCSKATLGDNAYPSLECMMGELSFSKASRDFWTDRRDLFAAETEAHNKSEAEAEREAIARRKRLAEEERVAAIIAQESLRWYEEANENPPSIGTPGYTPYFPSRGTDEEFVTERHWPYEFSLPGACWHACRREFRVNSVMA